MIAQTCSPALDEHADDRPESAMELDDLLTVIQRELQGVAATVGGVARQLTDVRARPARRPDALERLTTASATIERLATETQLLSAWMSPDGGGADVIRRWRFAPVGVLLQRALDGDAEIPVIANPPDSLDHALMRVSDDDALERTLRAVGELARRECGRGTVCQVRVSATEADVFFGQLSALVWDADARRQPAPRDGGLRQLVISAVLAAHGATVWRPAAGRGVGVSLPLICPSS